MSEEAYKIIEKINKRIGAVPVDEDGCYSRGDHMLVIGLSIAKDIVLEVAKGDDRRED